MSRTAERPPDTAAEVPSVPRPPVPWRGRDLAAVAGMGVLGLLLTILVGVVIGWDFTEFSSPQAAVILILNGTLPAVLAYGYLVLRFGHAHRYLWRPGGAGGWRWAPAFGLGLALGLAWFVAVDVAAQTAFIEMVGYEPPPVQQELVDALGSPGVTQVAAWLAIVVIAPLGEELVFRGIVFLGLLRWLGAIPAAVISSLLFGAIHLQAELSATLFLATYGLLFGLFACWLVHRFGSLWPAIGAHAASNLASVVLAAVAGQI